MRGKEKARVNVGLRPAATLPVWHWRGARPEILDLDENQVGSLVCLVFLREGECCLLPVARRYEQVTAEPRDRLQPSLPFAEEALDAEEMEMARRHLEQDGWRISGRLDLHFEGRWSTERFWKQVEMFLS